MKKSKYCTECGNEITESQEFCNNCGSKISDDKLNQNMDKNHKIEKNKSKNKKILTVIILLVAISIIAVFISNIEPQNADISETTRFSVGASTFTVQGNWSPKSAYNDEIFGSKKVEMERNGKKLEIEEISKPIYENKELTLLRTDLITKQYTKNNNTYYISLKDSNWGYFYFKGYEYHFYLEDADLSETEELVSYLIDNAN